MVASSIMKNFVISSKKQVERFGSVMEESVQNRPVCTPVNVKFIETEDELREFMRFREKKARGFPVFTFLQYSKRQIAEIIVVKICNLCYDAITDRNFSGSKILLLNVFCLFLRVGEVFSKWMERYMWGEGTDNVCELRTIFFGFCSEQGDTLRAR